LRQALQYSVIGHRGLRDGGLGILFFGNLAVFALAMGWGRAGLVPQEGLPIRYVLLAVPALCTAFFVWQLYGPAKLRIVVHLGLFLAVSLLLPLNMTLGLSWGEWYRNGMNAVEQDILAGTPRTILAKKHRDFLIHWWDEKRLAMSMKMLYDAEIEPFAKMRENHGKLGDSRAAKTIIPPDVP
jgi:hypothetical protein